MAKVSVILTAFNCGPYVGRAIESVLNQSFGDWELLISDDCSTDGSRAVIEGHARSDARITTYFQDENLGLVRNYNFLLQRAQGEFIAIQDADDWSDPFRFEKQLAILEDSDRVLCATGGVFHYPDGRAGECAIGPSHALNGGDGAAVALPASVMFRADLLGLYPGWPTYFEGGTSMDRYFLMELLDGRAGFHIGEPLYHARVRPGSSHRSWDKRKMATHQLFLELERQRRTTGTDWLKEQRIDDMRAFEERVQKDRRLTAASMRESAVIAVDCGQFGAALRLLGTALRLDPLSPTIWRSAFYLLRTFLRSKLGAGKARRPG